MLKYCCFFILFCCSLPTRGNEIEIRYHIPKATDVIMIWGVNDWNTITTMPSGTFIKDKVMHSPMVKDGEDFVLKLKLPDSSTIDYIFQYTKILGPFKRRFVYFDLNNQPDNKSYHSLAVNNTVIRLNPDIKKSKTSTEIPFLLYSTLFLFAFSMVAILLFLVQTVFLKSRKEPLNPASLFFTISVSLLCVLVIIRAVITGLAVQFLIAPWEALPLIFKTSYQDFIYTCLLTIPFGIVFFIKNRRPQLVLWMFIGFAVISILICMVNIKVIAMLGRPFTYQWLYYSDFLNSTDASSAIKANIETKSLAAYLIMCLAAFPLGWIIYHLLKKKAILIFAIFNGCLAMGYLSKNDNSISQVKRENPVIYFLSSLSQQTELSILSGKKRGNQNEFELKNNNVLPAAYAARFARANIKNVIVFVLESTPAEFVTPYNPIYNVTPFLDSIKSSSVLFDAVYAHAPATNKSLVSILCGVFPYLSYKSLTAEKPGIPLPSLPSELKKYGYRTSFFNSGDNRFQGAENFLKERGFNTIEDFRINPCEAKIFSDSRYSNENLEGIKDSCLSVKFFNWIQPDHSTPFFSMMWTYQTHYPYFSTGIPINFQTNNGSLEKYLNGLRDADETLRLLVEGLKKRGLLKSTLIVVTGDHGEAFGKHGQSTHAGGIFEENLHVPLMFINPELFKGEHLKTVGGISDIAPTVFSILNKSIPNQWQGENLFSINRREKVYFFSPYSDFLFGCREGNNKFIYNATNNTYSLFDLKTDPNELINIADKHPQYLEETKTHLNAWIQYQANFVNTYLK